MPTAVELRSVTKRYGALNAARDVSFAVADGEIFGLIGPNGAGKTTLLECLLGLTNPDAGAITVKGFDIGRQRVAAKEVLGAQLQGSALPDAMTPRQALTLCAAFYRQPARPADLIDRFELADKADARFSTLSAGQRQRVALALALVSRPQVLVLDEPTVGLDPPARADLHRLIRAQRDAGCTVLFSTHYLDEARQLCDRVALMHRGAVVALDAPETLIAASGATATVTVRTQPALPDLPGATRAGDDGWSFATSRVHESLAAALRLIETKGVRLTDVQIRQPTLDDAFARLTGGAR